ncbi:hypothetical protein AOLI_G00186630 [Acnodon oligacanthus]
MTSLARSPFGGRDRCCKPGESSARGFSAPTPVACPCSGRKAPLTPPPRVSLVVHAATSQHSRHRVTLFPNMAKREAENRTFLRRWEAEYLFTCVEDRAVCLVCGASASVTTENNIRRHYETKHQNRYKNLDMTRRSPKEEEMERSLLSQQNVFIKATSHHKVAANRKEVVPEKHLNPVVSVTFTRLPKQLKGRFLKRHHV